MPREPIGSRFPSQRPIEDIRASTVHPAQWREVAAGRCTRSLSRSAPFVQEESGPFCPICLGLRGGIPLTLPSQYSLSARRMQWDVSRREPRGFSIHFCVVSGLFAEAG